MKQIYTGIFSRFTVKLLFVLIMMGAGVKGWGQIFNYANTTATIPAGWSLTNNVATNPVDQSTYLLVDAGSPSDYILSSVYDLSAYTSPVINVKVATFGAGTAYPLKIEVSTDGGTTWSATTFTSATPSSATYIIGGPIAITQSMTNMVRFRFSNPGTSGRGVRIQNLVLTATLATPVLSISGTTNHGSSCSTLPATPITYTITNTGSVAATGVTVVSNDAQFVVSGLSSTTIAATNGTSTYNVTFTPASSGAKTATITVASTTSGSNSPTSSLTGTGSTPAAQTVTSSAAGSVTTTSAILNGNVTAVGVCPASTEKGFVYSLTVTNSTPTVGGIGVIKTAVGSIGTGAYTLSLSGLSSGTSYSFSSYVYDGTTYIYSSPVLNFTTLNVPPTLSAATGATVDNPFIITFTEDATWRTNITGITVGGITLSAGAYDKTVAGQITFTPSASTLLQTAGNLAIVVSSNNYSTASVTQALGAGVANKLAISTQPTAPATNGAVLATQPVVTIRDQYGNATTSTATVTAAVGAGTWTLGGIASVAGLSGTATFSGLTATSAAAVTGATISFSSTGLTGITSNTFNIPSPPPANDNCSGAISLTIGGAAISGTFLGATPMTGATKNDVFYEFTPVYTGSHTVTINTFSTALDKDLYVYSICPPTYSTSTNVVASGTGTSTTSETATGTFTAGISYKILVQDFGSGGGTFNINVTGPSPTLSTNGTTSFTFSNQNSLTNSASQSFNLTANALTPASGNITITAPSTNFQVSNDNSTWAASALVAYTSGVLASTPVYVRFTPQSSGAKTGNVTVSGGGATAQTIGVTGTGIVPAPVATAATNIAQTQFDANWNAVTAASSGYQLDVSLSSTFGTSTPGTLTEGFESGLPTVGYNTGSYSLSSGSWSLVNAIRASTANSNSGSYGLQLEGGTGASGKSPSLNDVGTLIFYAKRGSSATNLVVQKLISGVTTNLQTISLTTTMSVYTIAVNDAASGIQIIFSNGAAVAYIDDVSIGYNNFTPSFITGYNSKAISGQSTVTSTVTGGITANTTYYYRVRAVDANATSSNSNTITVTTLKDIPVVTAASIYPMLNVAGFSYFIIATNTPTSYAYTGTLPTGLSFNTGTGEISGTATQTGSFPINVTATNNGGTSTAAAITINVANQATADYRAKASGLFSTAAIWEYLNNGTYVQASAPPAATNNVNIQSTYTVTLDAAKTINTGKSITVNGTLDFSTYQLSGAGSLIANSGGVLNIGSVNAAGGFTDNIAISGSITLNTGSKVNYNAAANQTINRGFNYQGLVISGSGIKTVASGGTISVLENIDVNSPTTLALSGTLGNDLNVYGVLTVASGATFDNNGECQLNNFGGTLVLTGKFITRDQQGFTGSNTSIPTLPVTLNTGSTVEFAYAGAQSLTNRTDYYNITVSNSGTKTLLNTNAVTPIGGTVTVGSGATLDVSNTSFGSGATNLTLVLSGKFINAGSSTRPQFGGVYNLGVGSTVEFGSTSATDIRLVSYYNVLVSGTNVSTSTTGSITIQSGGSFTVANGATFKTRSSTGFSGGAATSVKNISAGNPVVVLETGSTIDYSEDGTQAITGEVPYSNLTISSTGTKNAPAALTISGNFNKTGAATFAHNNGTVLFNGSAGQGISAIAPLPDFYKITNSNTVGLTVNNDINIYKELLLSGSAKLNLEAGNITLKSTSTTTADLGLVPSGASISYPGAGRFIVERYILATRKWQFLAVNTALGTDVTPLTVQNSLMESQTPGANAGTAGFGTWITNSAPATGFDAQSVSPSMKWWDGSAYFGITDPTTYDIRTKPAYMTFVRGDRAATGANALSAPTVLRTKGMLSVGTQSPVTVDPLGSVTAIGNPYAAAIDLRNLTMTAATNQIINIEIWDPRLAGTEGVGGFQYLTYDPGQNTNYTIMPGGGSYPTVTPGVPLPMNTIESGQAFFIQSTGFANSVQFTETAKTPGVNMVSFAPADPEDLWGTLYLRTATGNMMADGFKVNFGNNYNAAADYSDAHKLVNSNENISVKTQNKLLAVEFRQGVAIVDTIHINMSGMRIKDYQWNFYLNNMDAPGRLGFLEDRFLGTSTVLNLNGSNSIDFTVTSAAGSNAANRFLIVFRQATVLPVKFTGISANREANGNISIKWKTENEINISRYELERSATGSSFNSIINNIAATNNNGGNASYEDVDSRPLAGNNYYRIKAFSNNGQIQYSAIVKVGPSNGDAMITVYPNTVTNGVFNVKFENKVTGKYNLQLINGAGQTVYSSYVTVSGNNQLKTLTLPKQPAAGLYRLVINTAAGEQVVKEMMIK